MTGLRRILKMMLAFLTGQGVTIMTQLLVPPLFLHRFANGVAVYGEWITLTAAVSYFGSLNFGVQNYAANQMTILRNRGEVEECRTVQASALLLLLWMMLGLLPIAGVIAILPVAQWLNLTHVGNTEARLVLEFFLMQLFAAMVFGLLSNSFMAVSRAHRGQNWSNAWRLSSTLVLAALVWMRASFAAMAGSQLAATVLLSLLVLVDLKLTAPQLAPALRYMRKDVARAMVGPSWHFTVLSLSGFLTWQAPVLLIQRLLGPTAVSVFSLTRTVFTMSRQALAVASLSIGPEITRLVGQKDWKQMRRLYDLSERVVLLLVPTVSVATLLASPWLLQIWLRNRNLYDPGLCILMALTSAAMGIKEHKYQFQASSNEHQDLSKVMVVAYGLVLLISSVAITRFGVSGFVWAWLAAEIAQTAAIFKMNQKLFPSGSRVTSAPLWRLALVTALVFAGATYPAYRAVHESLIVIAIMACAYSLLTALVCYRVFGLAEVTQIIGSRWRARAETAPAAP